MQLWREFYTTLLNTDATFGRFGEFLFGRDVAFLVDGVT